MSNAISPPVPRPHRQSARRWVSPARIAAIALVAVGLVMGHAGWRAGAALAQSGPAPPQLYWPYNGSTGIQNPVTLEWYYSYGAVSYDAAYMDLSYGYWTYTGYIYQNYVTLPSLTAGHAYLWYVFACDYYQCVAGQGWYFTMSAAAAAPTPPQPYSPGYGATGVNTNLSLYWYQAGSDTGYFVGYEDYTAGGGWIYSAWLGAQTYYTLYNLVPGDTYYWLVYGCTSYCAPSAIWVFTVGGSPPTPPQLYAPGNGAGDLNNPVTVSWYLAGSDNNYTVYYEDVTANGSWIGSPSLGVQTSYTLPSLASGHVYNWMVFGCTTYCISSPTWYFTMYAPPPTAPQLYTPANGASGVSDPATLGWYTAPDTDFYAYYEDANAGTGWQSSPDLYTATSYIMPQLPGGDTIYWYVWACTYTCVGTNPYWDFVLQGGGQGGVGQTFPTCTATDHSPDDKYACATTFSFWDFSSGTRTVTEYSWNGSLGSGGYNCCWNLDHLDVWDSLNGQANHHAHYAGEGTTTHSNPTFYGSPLGYIFNDPGIFASSVVYYCLYFHSNPGFINGGTTRTPAVDQYAEWRDYPDSGTAADLGYGLSGCP